MFRVLITDPLSRQGTEQLLNAPDVEVVQKTDLKKEELLVEVADADALIVRSQTQVTADVIQAARKLKAIGRAGVGVDNIDVPAATARGIVVVNAPDGNTISTAEHTFAMLISLARNIPQSYQSIIRGEWKRKDYVGVELNNKTLGILGLGRIGAELAKRARAFHMNVVAFDPYLTEERAEKVGVRKATMDEVIRSSDFITVHTPLTKETRHLIDAGAFARMKDGVRVLNCARGGIIDERALYDAIQTGKVAGAALDVFETEPPGQHPLFSLPQVIATPHLGASTREAQQNVAVDVSEEILHILRDEPFKNAVNLPSIPAELQEKLRPYQTLAEKLGRFAIQTAEGALEEITITVSGELTEMDTAPLSRIILKGALSHYLSDVNYVSAPYLARERGVKVTEQKVSRSHGFTHLIHVGIRTDAKETLVSGTLLNGLGPRIVKIDQYSVDVQPDGHLLLIHHHDRPGAIGRVGTILGNHDVNIATMQVGRKDIGGRAIMMLHVDKPISEELLKTLEELDEIQNVTAIDL
ncbi:D-3-phosphoglycerate dehydrogenase [Melghirimyces profundicolus]|uniref:D-3-phosphoglycerate dehydrogenase n=1 Tax=Melghirimyces profundicolus TaxID=1242148 RepID=A0A2T6BV01_9BACL|nr:phosphoglycerate dehydrogenase [Melghirimyces profundicolus]PTX59866.1 D-3-phosphoglycerate dehydrogenase [Melghirimyces profundicolus]